MAQQVISIRMEVDQETDHELGSWARTEGRSKRRHSSILLARLVRLRKFRPDELQAMPAERLLRELDIVR